MTDSPRQAWRARIANAATMRQARQRPGARTPHRAPRRWPLAVGAMAAGAALVAVAAVRGRSGASAAPATPVIANEAVRAQTGPLFSRVPWATLPAAVTAWVDAHAHRPSAGLVKAGKDPWAVLTTGPQPWPVRLLPLSSRMVPGGAMDVQVVLARGSTSDAGSASSLAVALQPGSARAVFLLHVVGAANGVALGPVAAGTCAPRPTGATAVRSCAARLGLTGAHWTRTGSDWQAELGHQRFTLTLSRAASGYTPVAVRWIGPT